MSSKIKHRKTEKIYNLNTKEFNQVMNSSFKNEYIVIEAPTKPKEIAKKEAAKKENSKEEKSK